MSIRLLLPRCALLLVLWGNLAQSQPTPAHDPAVQALIDARTARFEAASRALLTQLPQFVGLTLGNDGRLPGSLYHYAQRNEQWGVSLSLFHPDTGDDSDAEAQSMALSRKWWPPALLALTLDEQELELDEDQQASLLLQLLEDPDFGRKSALVRAWFRPFYVELASQPFPMPTAGQRLPPDVHGMVLAYMAAAAVDFERMLVMDIAGSICATDDEDDPSSLCVRIHDQLQRVNRGRPLFDQPDREPSLTLTTLVEEGCTDYANHARMMLMVLDAQDRAPLSAGDSDALLQQLLMICPPIPDS